MALHNKKDFADLCRLTTGNLSVYISRGKVILSGDYIDDALPQNVAFLAKRQGKGDAIEVPPPPPKVKAPEIVTEDPGMKIKKPKSDGGTWAELEKEKKEKENEKLREEIIKLQLSNAKAQGENIPTALVSDVFLRHTKSLTSSFKSGAENLIMEIEKSAMLTRQQVAALRGSLVDIINRSVEDAVKESKKEIGAIVKEFTIKKGVGEHG